MPKRRRALVRVMTSLAVIGAAVVLPTTASDAASSLQLRISALANRASPRALQHAVVTGPTYVFVSPTARVARVSYWIDDPHRLRPARHTDVRAPFDLVGGTAAKAQPWWTTGLRDGTHHLTAQVTTTGRKHVLLQVVFTVRNTPPAPTGLRAVPQDARVSLFWHSSGTTTRGFNVYRSTTKSVARVKPLNGGTLLTATSFVDKTPANGTTYYYVVVAVGTHGLTSAPTPSVSARPLAPAPTPPPAPTIVGAAPAPGQVTVSWQTGGGTTAGFNVFRGSTSAVPLTTPLNDNVLASSATSFVDNTVTSGKWYYVVEAVASDPGIHSDPSDVVSATFGGPAISLYSTQRILYASRNTAKVSGTIRITNVGDSDLTISSVSLDAAPGYVSTNLSLSDPGSFTLAGGQFQDVTFSFAPKVNGPEHAVITVTSDDPDTPQATYGVGGLAIDSAVNGEPSLQWIIDAYGLSADDGDAHPSSYPLDATSMPPSDGIAVTSFTRRDTSRPSRVTVLGAFVNPATAGDSAKDPAWGWMPANSGPGAATATFTARRNFLGAAYAIAPSGPFSIWAEAEGTTMRTDLNSTSLTRFIAFPVAGSPGTYVLADDTRGLASDDWNDLPLLIDNVTITASVGG